MADLRGKNVAYLRWLSYAALLAGLAGCSSGDQPTYWVGGRVTFSDGSPLDGGMVEFRSLDSDPPVSARGVIKPDGTYTLTTFNPDDGAVEGKHQVAVTPKPPEGDFDDIFRAGIPEIIAPRFRRFETSGLMFTVTREAKENDFPITVDRPK